MRRATYGTYYTDTYTGPVRQGVRLGIYGQFGDRLTLTGNTFGYYQPLADYAGGAFDGQPRWPTVGVYATQGAVNLYLNRFYGLWQGCVGPADAECAITANLFEGCYIGLRYYNVRGGRAGRAYFSCNTFRRPADMINDSYGLYLDYCGAIRPGDPCNQIQVLSENDNQRGQNPHRLLFEGLPLRRPNNTYIGTFWHLYNQYGNPTFDYQSYAGIRPTIGPSPSSITVVAPTNRVFNGSTMSCAVVENYPPGLGLRPGRSPGSRTALSLASPAVEYKEQMSQNVPNPFTGTTRIGYSLISGQQDAYLEIRDNVSGQLKKRLALDARQSSVEIPLANLAPGMYHYTLVVGGVPMAHKRMVILQP